MQLYFIYPRIYFSTSLFCLGLKVKIMQKEIFKDIPGYEGFYQVSNLGNVKSLAREILRKGKCISKEKILKPCDNGKGYYQVSLYKEGKQKEMRVHVLVAMAFLGYVPDGTHKIVPDHKDGNKLNNRADNLELITQRENIERYWLNQKKSSQYIGVCWIKNRNKWMANIRIDGKLKYLGLYEKEIDAHLAYQNALNTLVYYKQEL
jgi:hypothetical protein